MWWIGLFWLTIVFALVYFALYPGLGHFGGLWKWTSAGQYQQEVAQADAQYGPLYAAFEAKDLRQLAGDPAARALGQKLFLNHCAQCHASDGAGSKGFPNLTDRDWLWGGEPETIKASIAAGRNGLMPPMGASLGGEEGVKDVANYVRSLSGLANDSVRTARGREKFQQNCIACHGAEGKGNPMLGAPNLTDKVWLHGSSQASIVETILRGRNNLMPVHKDILGDAKVHVLAAYVLGMSGSQTPEVAAVPSNCSSVSVFL
jgi:cytochrome c oxidase cbb3-type subunit 3